MILKVALVALVFVAVHGQDIDNPENRVANKPIARPRRGAAEEIMKNLDLMAKRRRRSPDDKPNYTEGPRLIDLIIEEIDRNLEKKGISPPD
ncbi:hypothetical protein Q1695_010919 [Nippostrongylus brasiliensis]|nr:hypothetical protein Q1695_010919 [Nippostrongylus brasiliensis]